MSLKNQLREAALTSAAICLTVSMAYLAYTLYDGYTKVQIVDDHVSPQYIDVAEGQADAMIRLGDNQYSFFCSGVVIGKDFALTAAHCVTDMFGLIEDKRIMVSDSQGNMLTEARAVSVEKYRDIALLKGDFSMFQSILVDWTGARYDMLREGPANACGYPSGESALCSEIFYEGNMYFQMAFSGGQLYKGQSGGPVVVYYPPLKRLILIGVNSAVSEDNVIVAPVVGVRSILWGM